LAPPLLCSLSAAAKEFFLIRAKAQRRKEGSNTLSGFPALRDFFLCVLAALRDLLFFVRPGGQEAKGMEGRIS
jgi:hypothetical protein